MPDGFYGAVASGMTRLFLQLETLDPKTDRYYVPVFVIACWLLGVAVVIFDLALRHNAGKSIIGQDRGALQRPMMLISWPFGAGFFGFVALVVHVLQPSVFGGLVAAASWRIASEQLMDHLRLGTRTGQAYRADPPAAQDKD